MAYNEVQQFRQWWLWLLLIGIAAIPLMYLSWEALASGENDTSLNELGLLFLFYLITFLLFWNMKLVTYIDANHIVIRFVPFVKKEIKWSEVNDAQVLNYGFVGGWGIRLLTKYGTVYNISGNKGLAMTLRSGKKLCVGTQKEDELRGFIDNLNLKFNE